MAAVSRHFHGVTPLCQKVSRPKIEPDPPQLLLYPHCRGTARGVTHGQWFLARAMGSVCQGHWDQWQPSVSLLLGGSLQLSNTCWEQDKVGAGSWGGPGRNRQPFSSDKGCCSKVSAGPWGILPSGKGRLRSVQLQGWSNPGGALCLY